MSLNKILLEGKTGDGLDLEVRSISTAQDAGSLIRGSLTVQGLTDLMNNTTCEEKLDVVGVSNLYGGMTLNSKKVLMDGSQLYAQQVLIENL